ARQAGLGPRVDDPRRGRERAPAEPHGDARERPEIPNPLSALAMLGDQVEPVLPAREPDLDLAWLAAEPPRRRQVEVLRLAGPRGFSGGGARARRAPRPSAPPRARGAER